MLFSEIPPAARKAYQAARRRLRPHQTILSREEFVELWETAQGHCQLSGLPFSSDVETYPASTGYRRLSSRPWEPSLDQVVAGLGYQRDNVRLVCKCVNIGRSSYSDETFLKWVRAVAATQNP